MGVKFEYLPAITDTRGLSHATIIGMMAMDWIGKRQDHTSQIEDIVIAGVRQLCRQYVETVDLDKKAKVIYNPDHPNFKVIFEPAKHEGIDVKYYIGEKEYIVCNWSVDEYCENADDWYDDEEDEEWYK